MFAWLSGGEGGKANLGLSLFIEQDGRAMVKVERYGKGKDAPARPGVSVASNERYAAPFTGWVNYDLSEEDHKNFEGWLSTHDVWVIMAGLCERGYKFTVSREFSQAGFLATVIQRDIQDVNAGLMVSARSSDAARALAKLIWVVDARLPEKWSVSVRQGHFDW